MRIVCISDTHGQHRNLSVPDGDVLIHAGDICKFGKVEEYEDFDDWMGTLPHLYKIVIAGNHDGSIQSGPALDTVNNYTYLEDEYAYVPTSEETAVKFYGSPWTPPFFDWHFMLEPEEIAKKWAAIPKDTDVLITHGPPWGIGDAVAPGYDGHHGCPELLKAIQRISFKLHVFGHIHEGYGAIDSAKGFSLVNCSVLNEHYQLVNAPIVVDL